MRAKGRRCAVEWSKHKESVEWVLVNWKMCRIISDVGLHPDQVRAKRQRCAVSDKITIDIKVAALWWLH